MTASKPSSSHPEEELIHAELMRQGWNVDEADWIVNHKHGLTYAQARLAANVRELWRVLKAGLRR